MCILDTCSKYLNDLNQMSKYTMEYTGAEGTGITLAREVDFLKKLKVSYTHYLEMCWLCWRCRQFSLKNRTLLLILTVIITKYLGKNSIRIYLKFPQNKFQSHMHTSQQGQEHLFSSMFHQLWGPPSFLLG